MDQKYAPATALVSTTSQDEVLPLVAPPDSSVNFAEDETAKQWIMDNVMDELEYVRSMYSTQHEEWANIRRMTNLVRDNNAAYEGQSKAYLPVYQRAMETRASHITRGLFPTDTYIDVDSVIPSVLPIDVQASKAWMMHQLERSMRLRAELKPWIRTLLNYGTAVAKVWWEKPLTPLKRVSRTKLPGMDAALPTYGDTASPGGEGARFKARNIFAWYVWPVSVNSIDEASLVFEDIQVSTQTITEMGKAGYWKNTDLLMQGSDIPYTHRQIQGQLNETMGITETAVDHQGGELSKWRYVTECWLRMPVPDRLYAANEPKGCAVPVKVVVAGGQILEARRNPFWHQRPPYLMKRMSESPDSIFSTGMGRSAASLQYLANDFINQTNDNGIYGLNPIVKINPNLIVGPIEPLAPGRMWHLTDPAGAVFDRPPVEQMQYGLTITNQLITYLNDMSGAPSVLQGTGAKGGAKTATGAQILEGNVKGDLQDTIEDIELQILMPLMDMVQMLGQQYETSERYLAISGGEKIQFRREMLEAELAWKWVASSQATNKQMRAQQTISFAQLAGGMLPILAQQGKTFDPVPVLRRVWEDGLGLRNFDQVVIPLPMPQMGMPGMAPGGPPPEGGQEPRSTTEQAPGGGGEMVPGEGEAFGEVRQNADDLSAFLGGQG